MDDNRERLSNGVRVSNADIYQLLLQTNREVALAQQTIREMILPTIVRHEGDIDILGRDKADGSRLTEAQARLDRLEIRVYGIMAGLVAAMLGASRIGLI